MRTNVWVRTLASCVHTPSMNGELADSAEQVRQIGAHGVAHGDGPVQAAHAHVQVRGPGVVAPGHVLEPVLHHRVVRRVDDLLVVPVREGVRAGAAQRVALAVGVREQLGAVEQQVPRRLPEVQRARRGHLDLRAQQLAGDALAQAFRRRVAQRLEAGRERQRGGVQDLELLLQAQVEVQRAGEARLDLVEIGVQVRGHDAFLFQRTQAGHRQAHRSCGAHYITAGGGRAVRARPPRPYSKGAAGVVRRRPAPAWRWRLPRWRPRRSRRRRSRRPRRGSWARRRS